MNFFKQLLKNIKASQLVEKILIVAFSVSAGAAVTVYGVNVIKESSSGQVGESDLDDLEGKTYKYNQLIQNGDFSEGTANWTPSGSVSLSMVDGKLRCTQLTEKHPTVRQYGVNCVVGHKYLIRVNDVDLTHLTYDSDFQFMVSVCGADAYYASRVYNQSYTQFDLLYTAPAGGQGYFNQIRIYAYYTTGGYYDIGSVQVFDLTEWYGSGNEPSSLAEFQSKFPNKYYPFQSTPTEMTRSAINNLGN